MICDYFNGAACKPALVSTMTLLPSSGNDLVIALIVGAITLLVIAIKYRKAVRSRLKQLDVLRMIRVDSNETKTDSKMKQVELNPDFVVQCQDQCRMISLGDYLSSLRPNLAKGQKLPDWIDTAIQNAIARLLLKMLGPRLGKAFLPVLDTSFAQDALNKLVGKVNLHAPSKEHDGTVPLPLSAIPGIAQLNYDIHKPKEEPPTNSKAWATSSMSPINLLKGGEVGFSPSFSEIVTPPASDDQVLVPNPFIVSKHWNQAISRMEDLLVAADKDTKWKSTPNESDDDQQETQASPFVYDAQSKAMKEPVHLNERILPDLHLGWGSAPCTHTHQEILKNRLLSVLLNRLASNYYYRDETPFHVRVDESSKAMTRPTELMQALMDMGHTIESCVRSNITTFGVALCVKEQDDSWTNVPLAIFMHSGFSDAEGNESFACLPHSGLNVEIRGGPLLQHCSIQHYIAIEGKYKELNSLIS